MTCPNATVKIDKTPPTCTTSGGSTSWTTGNRTLTGTCSDAGGSGCRGNVTKSFTSNTNGSYSPGTVYDNAGNSVVCSQTTVKIDKSTPTCTTSEGNTSWARSDRTIIGTCNHAGPSGCSNISKVVNYDVNSSITPETVRTGAGATATCPATTVMLDKTKPTVSGVSNSSGGNWTNKNVTISFNTNDNLSGIVGREYSYNRLSWLSDWSSVSASSASGVWSAERNNTVYIRTRDNAGNISDYATTNVRIDKTAPTIDFDIYNAVLEGSGCVSFGSRSCNSSSCTIEININNSGAHCTVTTYPGYSDSGGSGSKSPTYTYSSGWGQLSSKGETDWVTMTVTDYAGNSTSKTLYLSWK